MMKSIMDTIQEYGIEAMPLSRKIEEKKGAVKVIAALNNADTDGVLLEVLIADPRRIFTGMALVAEVVGASQKVLYIPEYAAETAEMVRAEAEANGVIVEIGIVNVRANEKNVVCHIVTLAEVADAAAGKAIPGVYLSVNGAPVQKVCENTVLSELLGENVKAVQTGYTLRTADALNLTVKEAAIENGVLRALTDKDCVVDFVQKKLLADLKQSCGKCVFCREGLIQLEYMQKEITLGRGKLDYIDLTNEIGSAMTFSTPCSMGQKSAELPLSAMKCFHTEFEEHIKKKRCGANVCVAFRKVYVDPFLCDGCTKCMTVCEPDCIDGAAGYIHVVADFACIKCGKCVSVCPKGAIIETAGSVPKIPDRLMRVGRFRK